MKDYKIAYDYYIRNYTHKQIGAKYGYHWTTIGARIERFMSSESNAAKIWNRYKELNTHPMPMQEMDLMHSKSESYYKTEEDIMKGLEMGIIDGQMFKFTIQQ